MAPVWIEPAHVGSRVGPDASRRIQTDRLDDRRDDQGASDRKSDAKASRTRSAVYLFRPARCSVWCWQVGLRPCSSRQGKRWLHWYATTPSGQPGVAMDLSLLPGGRRLDWEHLSAPVREALQARLGSPVMHAATQLGGFSPGLAARLRLADGRRVFIKAAGLHPNPDTPALLRAEAQITAALPASAPSPRLLWSYDDQGWVALAFEDIQGKLPTLPWQP